MEGSAADYGPSEHATAMVQHVARLVFHVHNQFLQKQSTSNERGHFDFVMSDNGIVEREISSSDHADPCNPLITFT